MKQSIWFVGLSLVVATLFGCASSPQQLSLNPEVTTQLTAIGKGQSVSVVAADGRSSPILGTQGGLYPETSAISVESSKLVPKLQSAAESAVRLLGFTPTKNQKGIPELKITLSKLSYQAPKDSIYVTEADLKATFIFDVTKGTAKYTGNYSATLNKSFAVAPNAEANTKLVNSVLTDALSSGFSDANVQQHLKP